jgi:hypothetical protein
MTLPKMYATPALKPVMMKNPIGMMARSRSLSGEREKATFEKSRAGVKRETLSVLRVCSSPSHQLNSRGVRRCTHLLRTTIHYPPLGENPSDSTVAKASAPHSSHTPPSFQPTTAKIPP